MKSFEIVDLVENDDGSATLHIALTQELVMLFAKVGILAIIEDAATGAIDGRVDTEGQADPSTGEESDPPIYGEVPGL